MLNKYGEVLENVSLESYNTYGIKTSCDYLIKVDSINNLKELINYLKRKKISYYLLGKGSNVILPDNHFHGVIISLEKLNSINFDGTKVVAESGVLLSNLVRMAIDHNLGGLESLGNIPGTLGGALLGNASFYKEPAIYTYVTSVSVLRDGEVLDIKREDIKVSHRYSSFKDGSDIILGCTFNLYHEEKDKMESILLETRKKRMETQPLKDKNAGSVFKNPEGYSAGKLIDEAHLKGYSVNDAEVSNIHANFIINKGHAKSEDIKKLIKIIQDKIWNEKKVKLELEQIIVEWD